MRQREYFKRIVAFGLAVIYIVAISAVFAVAWYGYYVPAMEEEPYYRNGNYVLIGMYALVSFLFSKMYGGLRVGFMKKADIIYSLLLASLCANLFGYLEITLINGWFMSAGAMLVVEVVDLAFAILWTLVSCWIYLQLYPPRKMLLIYGDRKPDMFLQKVTKRKDKYEICGKVHISAGEEAIFRMMKEYEAVIIWDLPAAIRNRLLKYCFAHSIRSYVTPKISDILIKGSERIHLFDTPLLLSRNMGPSAEQVFAKRIMDIVISVMAILVFSPIMLLCALSVKLYDHGPILYRQERLTIGGKSFMINKFRSMRMDSEDRGAQLATLHDNRITPVGHVLRNLHFDELPQLFNVLKGDMSIVGPRPERRAIMRQYEKEIPEFYYRLKVKAGLTGYAQVYGKYNTVPYDKLKLDPFYIQNYSIWLDIKLMFMTFRILFQKETSEGISDNKTTALPVSEKGERRI